jgi:hypothetical protein
MQRLAHRKGRRLEAVAMRLAANLPQFEFAWAATFMFYVVPSMSAAAPSFAAKMPHRHKTREKIALRPIPFLHFPAFARNMA